MGILFFYFLGFFLLFVVLPCWAMVAMGRRNIKKLTGQTPEALIAANKIALSKLVETHKQA